MSKQSTKVTIDANIRQNGQQLITGQSLNTVLNIMVEDYAEQAEFGEIKKKVDGSIRNYTENKYISANGSEVYSEDYIISDFIPCNGNDSVRWVHNGTNKFICEYDADKNFITNRYWQGDTSVTERSFTTASNAKFIRGTFNKTHLESCFVSVNGVNAWRPDAGSKGLIENFTELSARVDGVENTLDDTTPLLNEMSDIVIGKNGETKDVLNEVLANALHGYINSETIGVSAIVAAYSTWVVTQPYLLRKGHRLEFSVSNTSYVTIGLASAPTISIGDHVTTFSKEKTGELVAEEDMMLVFSGSAVTKLIDISEDKSGIDERVSALEKKDSILSLNPKHLYENKIIQLASKFRNGLVEPIPKPVVLAWFSDLHGDKDNLLRLLQFCDEYKDYITDILSSGDQQPGDYTDDWSWWGAAGAGKVIQALGNHDQWTNNNDSSIVEGGYQGSSTIFLVKPKLCYDKFLAPYISQWGVTQPSSAASSGKCYFYKDYTYTYNGTTTTTMRMIVLDCMHYNVYSDVVGGVSAQQTWLVATLADARSSGIPVLMVSHYKGDNITRLECPWNNYEYPTEDITPLAREAVADFIDNGGELICWLNGHDHFDISGTFDNGRQTQFGIETAKLNDKWGNSQRVEGTKSQDAFNIIAFDTTKKLIKIVRIGDDYNRELQHKGILVYRYKDYTEGDKIFNKGLVHFE